MIKQKNISTSSYYEYAMKSDLKVTEPEDKKEEHTHKYTKFVKVLTEATCENSGTSTYKCENCDATQNVEEKKLEHEYILKMKNDKKHEKICERCGNVSSTSSHTLNKEGVCTKCEYAKSPHEHKFEKLIKEKQKATCTQKGIKVYKCTECDKTNEVEEKMLSHVFMLKSKNENKHQKVCTLCKKVESEANHQFSIRKR